jgi:hypothetical protein
LSCEISHDVERTGTDGAGRTEDEESSWHVA